MEILRCKVRVETENVSKKRNLLFFGPCDKYFRIAFVFGDKAIEAIGQSDLPSDLIEEVKGAKRYMEGIGLRIEVRKQSQAKDL